jgi:hypothetical protein
MRHVSSMRIAALALSLSLLGAVAPSFADTAQPSFNGQPTREQLAVQPNQMNSAVPAQSHASNFGPYDSPDFVVRPSDIHN